MKKKIIAIDIDDVIANSTEALRVRVNQRSGANLKPEHYNVPHPGYWGYYERVWKVHGVDIAYDDLAGEMEADQRHVPLLAGASFAISELSKEHKLIVITSRPSSWEAKTSKWLKENLGDIFESLHFTEQAEAKKTKGQLCKELKVDWLIDDNPEHCQSALDEGINTILFGSYGWHYEAPNHYIKCKDWPSVLDYFNGKER